MTDVCLYLYCSSHDQGAVLWHVLSCCKMAFVGSLNLCHGIMATQSWAWDLLGHYIIPQLRSQGRADLTVCVSGFCLLPAMELSASSGCTAERCSCIVRDWEIGGNHWFVRFSLHPCWWVSPGSREPASVNINVQHCSFHFWHQRYMQALVQ